MKSLFCASSAWVWKVRVLNESLWPSSVTITRLPLCSSRKRDCQKLLYVVKKLRYTLKCVHATTGGPAVVAVIVVQRTWNKQCASRCWGPADTAHRRSFVCSLHTQANFLRLQKKTKKKTAAHQVRKWDKLYVSAPERNEARRGEARAADVTLRVAHFLFAAAHLPENESHASRHRAVLLKCKVTFHKHGSQSVSIFFPFSKKLEIKILPAACALRDGISTSASPCIFQVILLPCWPFSDLTHCCNDKNSFRWEWQYVGVAQQ